MKCKYCNFVFQSTTIEEGNGYDRGDGVKYGTTVYKYNPTCSHCGQNNEISTILRCSDEYEM